MEDHMSLIRNGYTVSARWELGVSGGTLCGLIPDEVARDIAMVHPVKAAPYFAHAQFSAPETILALPDPGEAMPYVKAMWRYRAASPYRATSMLRRGAHGSCIICVARNPDGQIPPPRCA